MSLMELKALVNAVKFESAVEVETPFEPSGPNFAVVSVRDVSFYIATGANSTSVSPA
jgi:hypothetical protein